MSSEYETGGVDLDSLFAPTHPGWPVATITEYKIGGLDINSRYAPLSTGSAGGLTGYDVGGTDLNSIFAALGTTNVAVGTQPSTVSGSSAAGTPSGTVTSNTTTCAGSKGGGTYFYTWNFALGAAVFTNPHGATTAVTATVNAGSTASGTMFCTISDGISSINTSTVSWSLQNTSPNQITFTMTAGSSGVARGYALGSIGSVSGVAGLDAGLTIFSLLDVTSTLSNAFSISGFSSDPGKSYFSTIVSNGQTFASSSASYSYSGGIAGWTWATGFFGFASPNSYPTTVTR